MSKRGRRWFPYRGKFICRILTTNYALIITSTLRIHIFYNTKKDEYSTASAEIVESLPREGKRSRYAR